MGSRTLWATPADLRHNSPRARDDRRVIHCQPEPAPTDSPPRGTRSSPVTSPRERRLTTPRPARGSSLHRSRSGRQPAAQLRPLRHRRLQPAGSRGRTDRRRDAGQAYNPLFICGSPGVGKTHLLRSIANLLQSCNPGLSVRTSTGEAFTNEFQLALASGGMDLFKSRFRDVDVLLDRRRPVPRAQDPTEEEFFHTFNTLYEAGAQLVLTSDRPPRDLQALEDRLRERFQAGLVADIHPPTSTPGSRSSASASTTIEHRRARARNPRGHRPAHRAERTGPGRSSDPSGCLQLAHRPAPRRPSSPPRCSTASIPTQAHNSYLRRDPGGGLPALRPPPRSCSPHPVPRELRGPARSPCTLRGS